MNLNLTISHPAGLGLPDCGDTSLARMRAFGTPALAAAVKGATPGTCGWSPPD